VFRVIHPCIGFEHDLFQVMKFAYMRSTYYVSVLNNGLKPTEATGD